MQSLILYYYIIWPVLHFYATVYSAKRGLGVDQVIDISVDIFSYYYIYVLGEFPWQGQRAQCTSSNEQATGHQSYIYVCHALYVIH
jgi:hypothetical protein